CALWFQKRSLPQRTRRRHKVTQRKVFGRNQSGFSPKGLFSSWISKSLDLFASIRFLKIYGSVVYANRANISVVFFNCILNSFIYKIAEIFVKYLANFFHQM